MVIPAVVAYLFANKLGTTVATSVDSIADLQEGVLWTFSGILLVLLGLIAMRRNVLEIDLHHLEPLILSGFSSLLLALAVSYFLVKRAQISAVSVKEQGHEESVETMTEK